MLLVARRDSSFPTFRLLTVWIIRIKTSNNQRQNTLAIIKPPPRHRYATDNSLIGLWGEGGGKRAKKKRNFDTRCAMLTESTTETMTREKVVLCVSLFGLGNIGLFHPATIM
jgi:hypothetical protein